MVSDKNDIYNKSRYIDKTAYIALQKIRKEERRKIIYEMKAVAEKYGYEVISIIRLRETDGDKY